SRGQVGTIGRLSVLSRLEAKSVLSEDLHRTIASRARASEAILPQAKGAHTDPRPTQSHRPAKAGSTDPHRRNRTTPRRPIAPTKVQSDRRWTTPDRGG